MAAQAKRSNAQQRPAVSHRSMYDALKIEGDDSEEEQESEVEEAEVIPVVAIAYVLSPICRFFLLFSIKSAHSSFCFLFPRPPPLSKSARKKLSRQSLRNSTESQTPINIPENNHLDASLPALSVSTPEVEALLEMGVNNDGSGLSAGPQDPSHRSPSTISLGEILNVPALAKKAEDVKETVKANLQDRLPDSLKPSVLTESSSNDPRSTASSSAPAHPFNPTNLPASLPTLNPVGPTTPQKRPSPSDFVSSSVKEKKSVRFESSVVGQGESAEEAEKRIEGEKAKKKKIKDASVRTASTLAMIAGFFGTAQAFICLLWWGSLTCLALFSFLRVLVHGTPLHDCPG